MAKGNVVKKKTDKEGGNIQGASSTEEQGKEGEVNVTVKNDDGKSKQSSHPNHPGVAGVPRARNKDVVALTSDEGLRVEKQLAKERKKQLEGGVYG